MLWDKNGATKLSWYIFYLLSCKQCQLVWKIHQEMHWMPQWVACNKIKGIDIVIFVNYYKKECIICMAKLWCHSLSLFTYSKVRCKRCPRWIKSSHTGKLVCVEQGERQYTKITTGVNKKEAHLHATVEVLEYISRGVQIFLQIGIRHSVPRVFNRRYTDIQNSS